MADKNQMYYVGFCRICGTGSLGLRECGGCGEVVVMCDECDSAWTDANFSNKPLVANENDFPCPYCEYSLMKEPSRWAKKSKIDKVAWLQTALQSKDVDVQQGSAFGPEAEDSKPAKD